MTPPAVAFARILRALAIGAGLGIFYEFLRPLRPKFTAFADLVFSLAFGWGWVYLGFAVCGGDLRIGYLAALGVGCGLSHSLLGRALSPVFSWFWHILARIISKILLPGKNFSFFQKNWLHL